MRYIILFFLFIMVMGVNHLHYNYLLSGDAGMSGEYIGYIFIGPIIFSTIISAIVCLIARKRNSASFIRGCCWVMGLMLITSAHSLLRAPPSQEYVFSKEKITVTIPNKHWRDYKNDEGKNFLITHDANAAIMINRWSQKEKGIYSFKELTDTQKETSAFIEKFPDQDLTLKTCEVKGAQCRYQELNLTLQDNQKKRVIYTYLLDSDDFIIITATIAPEFIDSYHDDVIKIINSVHNTK